MEINEWGGAGWNNTEEYSGDIVIPESIIYEDDIYNVTSISDFSFAGCIKTESVKLPSSVVKIGKSAFHGCNMTTIHVSRNITTIGNDAFEMCNKIKSVMIDDIASWCNIVFESQSSNPLVHGADLYINEEKVNELHIPDGITTINDFAFEGCSCITSLSLSNSVQTIGQHSFGACDNLETVSMGSSVKSIGIGAFNNCSNLVALNLPPNLETIDYDAFMNCESIVNLEIPNSVTTIGIGAFSYCVSLSSVSLPSSIQTIGAAVFTGCNQLESITIPNSVRKIESSAFSGCKNLKKIVLGNNIQSIQSMAFGECKNLFDVYCYSNYVPAADNNAFKDSYIEYVTLHVPNAAINAYKQTTPWSSFKEIVSLNEENPEALKCASPTISYVNGKIYVSCDTEGAECTTTISNSDIKTHYVNEIDLTITYSISTYATAKGYEKSDIVTATLCWIDADPKTEGIENGVAQVRANAVLIQSNNGSVSIAGVTDGTDIAIYSSAGVMAGYAKASGTSTSVDTSLRSGQIAIVKIGDKAVKIVMK